MNKTKMLLTFIPTEEGGRQTPAFGNGNYLPQFNIDGDNDWVVMLKFEGWVNPGATVIAEGDFMSYNTPLKRGKLFHIREGQRIVAMGMVL